MSSDPVLQAVRPVPDCPGADVVAIGVVGDVAGEVGLTVPVPPFDALTAGLEVAAGWPGAIVEQPLASHDAVTTATPSHVIRRAREGIDMACS
jgi:hypothetical protein